MVGFVLPYPPSLNRHYRFIGRRVLISYEGLAFRESVRSALVAAGVKPMTGPLKVEIDLYPPDARVRDVDNGMKPLLDSLQHARVFANDSQIRRLEVEMCGIMPGGKALVRIDRYERRET